MPAECSARASFHKDHHAKLRTAKRKSRSRRRPTKKLRCRQSSRILPTKNPKTVETYRRSPSRRAINIATQCLQNNDPPHPHENGTCPTIDDDQNPAHFARQDGLLQLLSSSSQTAATRKKMAPVGRQMMIKIQRKSPVARIETFPQT